MWEGAGSCRTRAEPFKREGIPRSWPIDFIRSEAFFLHPTVSQHLRQERPICEQPPRSIWCGAATQALPHRAFPNHGICRFCARRDRATLQTRYPGPSNSPLRGKHAGARRAQSRVRRQLLRRPATRSLGVNASSLTRLLSVVVCAADGADLHSRANLTSHNTFNLSTNSPSGLGAQTTVFSAARAHHRAELFLCRSHSAHRCT